MLNNQVVSRTNVSNYFSRRFLYQYLHVLSAGNGYLVGYGNGSILSEAAAEVQDDDLSAFKNEYEDTSDSQIELTNV